jgi:hypothetical protein
VFKSIFLSFCLSPFILGLGFAIWYIFKSGKDEKIQDCAKREASRRTYQKEFTHVISIVNATTITGVVGMYLVDLDRINILGKTFPSKDSIIILLLAWIAGGLVYILSRIHFKYMFRWINKRNNKTEEINTAKKGGES